MREAILAFNVAQTIFFGKRREPQARAGASEGDEMKPTT
jgi:hypothetical protein